ncbi:Hypothetical predicted protein [Lecanosticta acicola]|uniref:Uncharacterized protein n=1 Tax=Lecanosticta acicola TaxID=111012 RepID=A0AAI8YY84_9PEZI|nr:Hypothetical predicted protein [Lecanosticta acicola]
MPFEFTGAPPVWGSIGPSEPFAPSKGEPGATSSSNTYGAQASSHSSTADVDEVAWSQTTLPFARNAGPASWPTSSSSPFGSSAFAAIPFAGETKQTRLAFGRMTTPKFGSPGLGTPTTFSNFGSQTSSTNVASKQAPSSTFGTAEGCRLKTSVAGCPLYDRLAKALIRLGKKKPALFSSIDISEDKVLGAMSVLPEDTASLLEQLQKAENVAPHIAAFTKASFGRLVNAEMQKDEGNEDAGLAGSAGQHAAKLEDDANSEIDIFVTRDYRDDLCKGPLGYRCEAPGCWGNPSTEYHDDIPAWRVHFWAFHKDLWRQIQREGAPESRESESDSDEVEEEYERPLRLRTPRDHPLVQKAVETLIAGARLEDLVNNREGVRVLANYTIDLFYRGAVNSTITDELESSLGGRRRDGLTRLVHEAREALEDVEKEHRLLPPSSSPQPDSASQAKVREAIMSSMQKEMGNLAAASHGESSVLKPNEMTFRFLDLPAEMRNLVYRELLAPAPGYIGLTHRGRSFLGSAKSVRQSHCRPLLLATCKQIHKEAAGIMYQENTVMICAKACMTNHPMIRKELLPDPVLSKLTSLVLVLENRVYHQMRRRDMDGVHWKQIQDMTALKKIRICIVEPKGTPDVEKVWMLEHIMERIPADCSVSFEARRGFEDDFVQEVLDKWEQKPMLRQSDATEVDEAVLKRLASQVKGQKGCKSGDPHDYRFPKRGIPQLGQLGGDVGEVDPGIVLGGLQT